MDKGYKQFTTYNLHMAVHMQNTYENTYMTLF